MDTLRQDLRHGLRQLRRNPGLATVAVVTLALGIGANTAMFSVVHGVLLRPLPYEAPDRLAVVWETAPERGERRGYASWPNFVDFREATSAFGSLAAFAEWRPTLTGEGPADRLEGGRVSHDFFATLGVTPALGRAFLPEEDVADGADVVLLDHGLWLGRLGADPGVLDRTLTLSGRSYRVVGVLPPEFYFPPLPEATIWRPLSVDAERREERGNHFLRLVGRLSDGSSPAGADEEMRLVAARLAAAHPESNRGRSARVVPLDEELVGDVRPALLVLLGAVGLVLLIACANVANVFLARSLGRRREMGVRVALGAARGRILRQLLTETVVVALVAGALGLAAAFWAVESLVALVPEDLPRQLEIGVSPAVLAFTLGVSVLTGLLFGSVPALDLGRLDLRAALREGDRRQAGERGGTRLRSALVVTQLALALTLLAGAGLLLRSLGRLVETDPGLEPRGVLTFDVDLPPDRYPDPESERRFARELLNRLRALPEVRSAGTVVGLPFRQEYDLNIGFTIQGGPPALPSEEPSAKTGIVTAGYFEAMGIPRLRGRTFRERDDETARPVVVINQTMARRFWPDEDPLGQRIELLGHTDGETEGPREIVGVVGDVRQGGLAAEPRPEMYVPHHQFPIGFFTVALRAAGDPARLAGPARTVLARLDPQLPLGNARTMEELIAASAGRPRFYALLLGGFAGMALLLAAVGIYGVISYSVGRRTAEVGVRIAVGARPDQVVALLLRQAGRLAALGIGIGIAAGLLLTRLLGGLLHDVRPADPASFAVAVAVLGGVALLAGYIPARRAARVDPVEALRHE